MTAAAKQLVTRSELATRAGVTRAAITIACKKRLLGACDGDRIDLQHPAVVAYLESKGVAKPKQVRKAPKRKKAAKRKGQKATKRKGEPYDERLDSTDPATQDDLEREEPYASMTLREINERFPTRRAFKDRQDQAKRAEEIRRLRLDNDVTEGKLISRELVDVHVIGVLEGLSRKLLQDMPKTAARLVEAAVKANEPIEVCEKILHDLVSKQLKPARSEAVRKLRNA